MSILEIILSACLFGLSVAWYGETVLKREACAGWDSCIEKLSARSQQNYELRAKIIALAERNHHLENQISTSSSRRYERN